MTKKNRDFLNLLQKYKDMFGEQFPTMYFNGTDRCVIVLNKCIRENKRLADLGYDFSLKKGELI